MTGVELESDDLFIKMFHHNKQPHPLIHMAWADWCARKNHKSHMAFLNGHVFRVFEDHEKMWEAVQTDLVHRYLYPSALFLRDLVEGAVEVLHAWVVAPEEDHPVFREGGKRSEQLHVEISQLFDEGENKTWLDALRNSLKGEVFRWETSDMLPFARHFTDLGTLKEFLPELLAKIGDSPLYHPFEAKLLYGSIEDGYTGESIKFIERLLLPLKQLVTYVAKQDQYRFGNPENLTWLGQLHKDLTEVAFSDGQKWGAAFFAYPPRQARYVDRFEKEVHWKDRNRPVRGTKGVAPGGRF